MADAHTTEQVSRRGAIALAAALAATVATAVVAYGGLRHWQAQPAAQPAVAVQPAASVQPVLEESD